MTDKKTDKPVVEETWFDKYNQALVRYPFLINAVQSAVIAALGVMVSQQMNGAKHYDWTEVRAMVIINFIFMTPILLAFISYLNNLQASNLTKLAIDQLLFSPPFTAGIIGLRLFLLGTDLSQVPGIVIKVLPKAMVSSMMFWLPTRFLIMSYVPAQLQLLTGSLGGFVWNVIFSMILS
ncbi:hypothetical protein EON65_29965 [archaeon]|nr:MAG: hypothetical protein EON65_29965 [archaeon]